MSTWIKPAVGWGIVDEENRLCPDQWDIKAQAVYAAYPTDRVLRVAQVPLSVAWKAGLLKRPKDG
jgi:hypothetical protein